MVGVPQLREVGWLVTGSDRDPVRHLFLRMEQTVDGTGEWTVELSSPWRRAGEGGRVMHRYPCEDDARAAAAAIYALGRHVVPLPTWDQQRCEPARWCVRTYAPEPARPSP